MAEATLAPVAPTELVGQSSLFGALPPAARDALVGHLERREVLAGAFVVREGELGDSYYLIAAGQAEAWVAKGAPPAASQGGSPPTPAPGEQGGAWQPDPRHDTLVERLGPGDSFGEIPLLLGAPQPATVRAATDLVLYTVDGPTFSRVVQANQGLEVALQEEMALRAVVDFLGERSPFATLPPEALRWLALRLQAVRYEAGQDVVRQGEPGDALYIVRSGQAEVLARMPDGTDRRIATLGFGDVFGEQALLTDDPRSATVRALEPLEALRLGRADFLEVLQHYQDRARYFVQLVNLRQLPRRIDHCTIQRQPTRDGQVSYLLEDTQRHRFVRISGQGAFLWDLMDGEHTVRDLAMAYFQKYQSFGLYPVLQAVLRLHAAGFVQIQHVDRKRLGLIAKAPLLQRIGVRLLPLVSHYYSLPDVDHAVTVAYRFLRPLYFRPVQALLLVVMAVGTALFLRYVTQGGVAVAPADNGHVLVVAAILGLLVQALLHETGHAVTTKHFGRQVHHMGVGWYLFMPVAFTDTSEMWTAGKWQRAAVDIAGPYVNFLLSSVATLLIPLAADHPTVQTALFHFAVSGYFIGVLNLNPLIQFDGYYVLMDLLELPNLRSKALAFLGALLWQQHPTARTPALARIYGGYGALALVYVLFIAVMVLKGYEAHIEGLLGAVLPSVVGALLGWVLAGLMCWLILFRTWRDLRAGVEAARKARVWAAAE